MKVSALAFAGVAAAKFANKYPMTTVAGTNVVDTPLVREARELIEVFQEKQPYLVKHLYRTWLFGAAALDANETLKADIDLEFHAVGTLLHDLGWDMRENSPFVTPEERFEVDSGNAAVKFVKDFIKGDSCAEKKWSDARLEKLFDGIALQTEESIVKYKNPLAKFIFESVGFEFPGPRNPAIPEKEYNSILEEYPNDYLFRGSIETFTHIAATKPDGTYNTFVQQFGETYVKGYNSTGKTLFDQLHLGRDMEVKLHPDAT
ncbi:hypothetical protein F4808DRAFT_440282, partial [Astrocystis sublimbata]